MNHIKLFEQYIISEKFYCYKVSQEQEVIIRNDTIGRQDLVIPQGSLKSMLKNMGGVDSIKTDFPVNGRKSPFPIDFAINACLFEPGGKNTGYFRFYNKEIIPINTKEDGNFGMHLDKNSGERNGVFYGEGSKWNIIGTSKFKETESKFAIQNGPILILNGKINSVFNKDSKNRDLRNGIGVDENGLPCFVFSRENNCNFYELADYMLNTAKCKNAIYSDGNVVQAYIRGRKEGEYFEGNGGNLGPLILVTSKK
jgi:uncharacterized protein YigE (DUF2233 family)